MGITKLFLSHPDFEQIRWIAGAVACGVASALMLLTGTVHPPGGASAVLAATSPDITAMGWYFVGLVMLGTALMLGVALVVNNLQRQFPVYWWTPLDVRRTRRADEEVAPDARGGFEFRGHDDEKDAETGSKDTRSEQAGKGIYISAHGVEVPRDLALSQDEADLLERLKLRLAMFAEGSESGEHGCSADSSVRSSTEITVVPSHSAAGRCSRDGAS